MASSSDSPFDRAIRCITGEFAEIGLSSKDGIRIIKRAQKLSLKMDFPKAQEVLWPLVRQLVRKTRHYEKETNEYRVMALCSDLWRQAPTRPRPSAASLDNGEV